MRRTLTLTAATALAGLVATSTLAAQAKSTSSTPPAQHSMAQATVNWYGGPAYLGAPSLEATAALVKAGGGAAQFSFAQALVSMLGEKTVNAEVAKLEKQYGKKNVADFISGMDYAVKTGLKLATEAGVKLPAAPANLEGVALAKALVAAGTTADGTFWSGALFDHALSHDLHNQVMLDIDKHLGGPADQNVHRILNQAMYDVAQALGMTHVQLASLH